jgi:type II secretory pathway predicted ATPase ExeA
MYYDYFGLKQPPFRITPDTNLFFPGGERGAVLDALIFAVTNGEGIIKVVGEVGSGKTMLCRMLQKELPAGVERVYLANPSLSPENILQAIAFELKLPVTATSSKLLVMHLIQEYLLKKHAQNQQVVVFVEEAQGMPLATLEEIRLLSNLETNQNKLLQIILFGQPELDQKIGQREIRQLKERITYSFQLNPFRINDVKEYINSRLRFCGYRAGDLFSEHAYRSIAKYSNGLVRRINILADKAMLAAYAGNTNRITAKHVRQAARDSEFHTSRWRYWLPSSVMMVMLIGAMSYWIIHGTTGAGRQDGLLQQYPAEMNPRPVAGPDAGTPAPPQQGMSAAPVSPAAAISKASIGQDQGSAAGAAPGDQPVDRNIVLLLSDSLAQHGSANAAPLESTDGVGAERTVNAAPAAAAPHQAPPPQAAGAKDALEGQLIGLNEVFRLQDVGDSRLTDQELTLLRRQLKSLPPEEAVSTDSASAGDDCKLCWSIIYRPLLESGNL